MELLCIDWSERGETPVGITELGVCRQSEGCNNAAF